MNIPEKITLLRNQKGLSVNKLANMAGLSQGFVRQIELGEKNPTVESLKLICEALDISLSDFFNEQSEPSKEQLIDILKKNISSLDSSQLQVLISVAKSMNKNIK